MCQPIDDLAHHLEQHIMSTSFGKSALVTGASRGIGADIARRLARDGFSVVVNYAHGADEAVSVVSAIRTGGGQAIAVQADVSDPTAMSAMFDRAEQAFGGLDVLVNNAGIMGLATISESDDRLFDETLAVNLKGVFNGLREASRRLREGGRIVNLSSSVVGLYQPGYAVYAASKAGVEAMTRVLANELGPRKITVNAVAPGPIATELFLRDKSDKEVTQIVDRTPLGRLGKPGDIGSVVSFLAGPEGAWVNGQVLRVNGGII